MEILMAVLALGGVGLAMGLVLAAASRVFAVPEDEILKSLEEALPGANCGGCGFAGCAALAGALRDGTAEVNACPVGGIETAERLGAILGVQVGKNTRLTALVRCSGGLRAKNKYAYEGLSDCLAAMRIGGGSPKECQYGCIGLGTCVASCPWGAISLVDGVAVVDHERCTGCLRCAESCPKKIIIPVPYHADVNVACSSQEKGGVLRRVCDIGCLGCRMCEKVCQYGAIRIKDNLASIDFDLCVGCGDCAEKCPRKLIVDAKLDRTPRVLSETGD
ncbi:MAG: RnfABCDGE type electron transport complex subunit B [Oscillospiraceae bacterium]|jgi:Na+-translocating ferredoxin:NAD+ oxidoreductase RNF subunit RnfB|nr:RnfABCDGE type electron transport complex subunit B [Oscillospiraceae bacterium]